MSLESGQLPNGWRLVRLGDVLKLRNGYAFKPTEWSKAGRPIIRIQNLKSTDAPYNYFLGNLQAKYQARTGDLLFAWSGTPGTSFGAHVWSGPEAWINQHIFRVDFSSDDFDRDFLKLALDFNLDDYIADAHGGVGLAHITKSKLDDSQLLAPPLQEQRSIARAVNAISVEHDSAMRHLQGSHRALQRFRNAALITACSGRLTSEWREANPCEPVERALARVHFKQSTTGRSATDDLIVGRCILSVGHPGTPAPEGWQWVPLSRVARLESGHTPSRKHPEYWNGAIPWIGIQDAREHHGGRIFDTRQTVNDLGLQNSAARLLPTNTVCLSRTASVGYVLIMGRPMATSQDFVNWICSDALLPDFLLYAIMAEGEGIRRFGRGTTHTTIYFPEVKALHICLPPVDEQHEIVRRASRMLRLAEDLLARLDGATSRMQHCPQAVLAKAFRGELKSFAHSSDISPGVLAAWPDETNRLPPQRPGPA
jgi:type I restriction enzyme S subunit